MCKCATHSVCVCGCFLDVSVTGAMRVLVHKSEEAPLYSSCGGEIRTPGSERVPASDKG